MKLSEKMRMPNSCCLRCGKAIDAAAGIDAQGRPDPGDWSICLNCGYVMAYADDLTLRELTEAEKEDLLNYPEIVAFQRVRREALE